MLSFTNGDIVRWLGEFFWPFLRTLALFSAAPLFSAVAIPVRARVALAGVIAIVLAPTVGQSAPLSLSWAAMMLTLQQVLVGLAIGFAMQVALTAMAVAGDFVGVQMGFGFAGLFDVQSRFQVPVMSDLFNLVGLLMFVTLNGHLILLGVLVKSFAVVPIAADGALPPLGWHALAAAGGPLFELRASVPNQPGVVAQLALELGRAGVNITDMALYPALDMSEGVIALWIAGEEQARRTEELVGSLGFPVARA